MATADVVVRGAGIFGLTAAWSMARRGARVVVVDPHGVAAGSSGGPVGALAPHTPENWNPKKAFQLQSLLMARSYWPDVEAASGLTTGYGALGRVQALQEDRSVALAREREAGADALWKDAATWRVITAEEAPEGWLMPQSATGYVVHDTLSARIAPRLACQSLVAAIQAKGGQIVRAYDRHEGPVLDATGVAGLEALSVQRGRAMGAGVKGQAAVLRHDAGKAPQVFVEAMHVVPHADGTVAVGSTSEREFAAGDTTDDQLDALINRVRRVCPALEDAPVLARWAGVRPRARSRAPMLGAWPDRPGVFIANGGFKIGFGMAPLVGEVIADLILDGRDRIPEDFRVEASL